MLCKRGAIKHIPKIDTLGLLVYVHIGQKFASPNVHVVAPTMVTDTPFTGVNTYYLFPLQRLGQVSRGEGRPSGKS